MKALSVRQPWAWLIVHGFKPVENRTWRTKFRGRFLVHAAKGMTRAEYARVAAMPFIPQMPPFEDLERGGIVGSVELTDCVDEHDSEYFFGPVGFVLKDPEPLPFRPYTGMLGFFEVEGETDAVL